MKIFLKNIHLLNFLLIALIGIFAHYLFLPSHTIESMNPLPSAQQSREAGEETATETEIPSSAEYTVVADENLFHPERKIPVEKKEEQPLPKPDFVLYGILITDDMRIAYMEDLKAPRNTPGRGKRQTAMRKGDALSGFALKEIETDRVVMLRGEEKIVVPVSDPSRSKERKETGVVTTAPEANQKPPQQMPAAVSRGQGRQQSQAASPPSASRSRVFRP